MSDHGAVEPLAQLEQLFAAETQRLGQRRTDLAAAGNSLMVLRAQLLQGTGATSLGIELLSHEIAAPIVDRVSNEAPRVDNVVLDNDVGAGVEADHQGHELIRLRAGQVQRSLYAEPLLSVPGHRARFDALRAAGQEQRVLDRIEHEFAIFGDAAVVTPTVWGDAGSDYLVIRNPAIIGAFQSWFDLVWSLSPPRSDGTDAIDRRLVELLSLGYKDEAIARHLGVALRTVRRRVAALMDAHGVSTRFQLGAALVRDGLMP